MKTIFDRFSKERLAVGDVTLGQMKMKRSGSKYELSETLVVLN